MENIDKKHLTEDEELDPTEKMQVTAGAEGVEQNAEVSEDEELDPTEKMQAVAGAEGVEQNAEASESDPGDDPISGGDEQDHGEDDSMESLMEMY